MSSPEEPGVAPTEVEVTVELLTIADAVQIMPDGRVNLLGAVPEFWTAPAEHPHAVLPIVLIVSTNAAGAGSEVGFGLRFVSQEHGELFRQLVKVGPPVRPLDSFVSGARIHRPIAIQLEVDFISVGPHAIELLDPANDTVVARASFSVRLT